MDDQFLKIDASASATAPEGEVFTISEAMMRIGGFGRFQMFALIVMWLIRGLGLYQGCRVRL